MLGAGRIGSDERQVDIRGCGARQFALGFFRGFFQPLQSHGVLAQVHAVFPQKFLGQVVDDALIKVVAAQVRVAIGGFDFKDAIPEFEDGNVKRAAAKVVHRDFFIALFVQAVREGGRGGFVDDARDLEARDFARVFGGLPLRVIKISGHGDDGFCDRFAEVVFGGLLHFLQHHRRDLGRRIGLAVELHRCQPIGVAHDLIGHFGNFRAHLVASAAHEALDRVNGFARIGHGLAFGNLTDEAFPVLRECDNRGRGAPPFGIWDDHGIAAFHHGDTRVGRSQVNTNDFAHCGNLLVG